MVRKSLKEVVGTSNGLQEKALMHSEQQETNGRIGVRKKKKRGPEPVPQTQRIIRPIPAIKLDPVPSRGDPVSSLPIHLPLPKNFYLSPVENLPSTFWRKQQVSLTHLHTEARGISCSGLESFITCLVPSSMPWELFCFQFFFVKFHWTNSTPRIFILFALFSLWF